jgi:hypothetical protein
MTSSTMDCAEARISLGVYVLGAIDPAERTQVDTHLSACQECRDELAGLAGLPALLARVSKEEAIALADTDGPPYDPYAIGEHKEAEPSRELLATVLDLTAARRTRRRWSQAGLTVAAAAIVAAGVFGGLQLGSAGAQPATAAGRQQSLPIGPVSGSMETVSQSTDGMTATVSYSNMGWGTALDTSVTGIPVGTNCKLYVIESNGTRVLAGNWVTDPLEGKVWYPGSVGTSTGTISAFEITVGQDKAIQVTA